MKREEEIKMEADVRISIEHIPFKRYFIQGAEWADSHPRKGMVHIDDVCKLVRRIQSEYRLLPDFAEHFRRVFEYETDKDRRDDRLRREVLPDFIL